MVQGHVVGAGREQGVRGPYHPLPFTLRYECATPEGKSQPPPCVISLHTKGYALLYAASAKMRRSSGTLKEVEEWSTEDQCCRSLSWGKKYLEAFLLYTDFFYTDLTQINTTLNTNGTQHKCPQQITLLKSLVFYYYREGSHSSNHSIFR